MSEEDLGGEEEKKSSKKLIIIIAVVLLLAGGGAGYYFMTGDSTADTESTEEVEEELEESDVEEIYYDIKKPLIVNFPRGSDASLIQVSVSLLVNGEEAVTAIIKHEPMIRNNLLMAISAKGAKNLMLRKGKEELRDEMLKEISGIMKKMTGKNNVSNVFFTSFVMQ